MATLNKNLTAIGFLPKYYHFHHQSSVLSVQQLLMEFLKILCFIIFSRFSSFVPTPHPFPAVFKLSILSILIAAELRKPKFLHVVKNLLPFS